GEVTVEDLAKRLQVLEQRLGVTATTADSAGLADLDQRLRVIERKLELQAEESAAKAAKDPVVSLSPKGLSIKSPASDGIEVKFKALVQADGRVFLDDEQLPQNDTLLLRRVEPTIEGTWGPLLGFRLQAESKKRAPSAFDGGFDATQQKGVVLRKLLVIEEDAAVGLHQRLELHLDAIARWRLDRQ